MAGNRTTEHPQGRHQEENRQDGFGNPAQQPIAPPEDPAGKAENLLKSIRIEPKNLSGINAGKTGPGKTKKAGPEEYLPPPRPAPDQLNKCFEP